MLILAGTLAEFILFPLQNFIAFYSTGSWQRFSEEETESAIVFTILKLLIGPASTEKSHFYMYLWWHAYQQEYGQGSCFPILEVVDLFWLDAWLGMLALSENATQSHNGLVKLNSIDFNNIKPDMYLGYLNLQINLSGNKEYISNLLLSLETTYYYL
ncbi:hypothetical protein ACJX0J_014282 [Zea mays]